MQSNALREVDKMSMNSCCVVKLRAEERDIIQDALNLVLVNDIKDIHSGEDWTEEKIRRILGTASSKVTHAELRNGK